MKNKVKCWQLFECDDKDCPVHKSQELRCWLIPGTHCRNEIQGKFLEKMEMCLECELFRANMDVSSMEETLRAVNKQLTEFGRMLHERDKELEDTSMELALGLSEAFEALQKISSGDPLVRIAETSKLELIAKLKHMVNVTAAELAEIVDLSHEFAIGLAEHFDALHRVSKGNLSARVSGASRVELLESLGKVTNQMIESISREINDRKRSEDRIARLSGLKGDLLSSKSLSESLKRVTDGVVEIFDADFCRIWITKPGDLCDSGCLHAEVTEGPHVCRYRERCLHLMASSGRYTHVDGAHGRVPLGCYKIGRVASGDDPKFVTNDVTSAPRVHDHDWARKLGLVSFAGYRLLSEAGRPTGVLALFSKRPISRDEDALLEGLANTVAQVIQTARAEKALRESEERFKDISYSMADWIWEVDNNGKYTFASGNVRQILGYDPEELIGKTPFDIMPEDEARHIGRVFKEIVSGKRPIVDLENWNLTKQGERICLLTNGVPILDENGELLGYRGVDKNITEHKKAKDEKRKLEVQLRRAERMETIGTLAGGIAHDFNNILGAIVGYTELAQMDMPPNTVGKTNLKEVLKAGKRAKALVKQILTFSRQSEGERRPLQVGPIVKEALKLLRPSIPTTIEVRKDITTEPGTVLADATQIEQVIMNLCTNAAHAMQETGGILDVKLAMVDLDADTAAQYPDLKPGPYVRLAVSDTGGGIDEAIKERIFDPFFTTKGPREGTGMGLAVVHGIVKGHGGAITVYSEPGEGTTFHVLLPRTEAKEAPEAEKAEALPTGSERVLVVDDEEALVGMGEQMLRHLGYDVVPRTSSIEALEAFRAQPDKFDLIITDQTMPNMTGEQLAREVKGIRPDIPVVLCTGYSQIISEEKAKAMGISGFLMKPVVMKELAETTRRVLDEKKQEGQ